MNKSKKQGPTRIWRHNSWYDKISNNFYGIVNILQKYASGRAVELQDFNEITCVCQISASKPSEHEARRSCDDTLNCVVQRNERTAIMPTGSEYSRVDPVLGIHRCLFSEKPTLISTASQNKSKPSIFCVIFLVL